MTIKVTYNVTDVYVTQDVSPVYINVSYSTGASGSGAVWGSITGTLSDQTDLQTALDGKFDDPTGTSSQYIDGTGALQTFPLTLPVLQEVRNQTGATLDAGTVVYINGATGNKPTVTKAIATGDATSAQTLGMVSAAIANNGTGYVVVIGTCSGLDTSAFTEGQQLYLSYTTAGAVTTTKPYAPYHLVYIGIVTRAHPTLGTVEVRVQNGYELDEIHDVDALNPNNNDGIFYNSTTSLWEHKQISTALGYTPANAATTITINGVSYDLSTSRTWSVGSVTGTGASGQVAYWTGASTQAGSNNLFWDNANGRLGVGTNAPISPLQLNADMPTVNGLTITRTGVALADANFQISNLTSLAGQFCPSYFFTSNYLFSSATIGGFIGARITNNSSSDIGLILEARTKSGTALSSGYIVSFRSFTTDYVRIAHNGNMLLQNGGTFTDSGERLQVTGDVKVTGSGATFATTALLIQNSSSTQLLRLTNDGSLYLGPAALRAATTFTNIGVFLTGSSAFLIGGTNSTNFQNTSSLLITRPYAPTSGSVQHNAIDVSFTINQQGGANGITRGLYINPTLTAASDFRAIETTNGKVIFGNLPTSSAGLPTGAIWNDAGTIKIV